MAYWYIAHGNELLLDLDEYDRHTRKGPWGDAMFRQRLRDAINSHKLEVGDVFLEPSNSAGHFHVFIRLLKPMGLVERMIWQLRLGSDTARSHSDLMRMARGIRPASLLIRTSKVEDFYREPDEVCPCPSGKHVTTEQVKLLKSGRGCPVWERLRGATPWELFGQPAHMGIERPMSLPIGRVPLELILKVGDVKEKVRTVSEGL